MAELPHSETRRRPDIRQHVGIFADDHRKSNRSRFITLTHAATKSCKNCSCASELPYTSASARSTELEPNTRSTRVAVHLSSPDFRSWPSNVSLASETACHSVRISSRFLK